MQEIVKADASPLAKVDSTPTIEMLLSRALDSEKSGAELKEILDVMERLQANKAHRAMSEAMGNFQGECRSIPKISKASFVTKSGSKVSYDYAELSTIASVANPILGKFGLSYTWDSTCANNKLTCICTLRHCDGASVSASIELPIDAPPGSAMGPQQVVASTLTFARRQTLIQVLGLTTCDPDDDCVRHEESSEVITQQQADEIVTLMAVKDSSREKFLTYFGIAGICDLPAKRFDEAMRGLRMKPDKK